VADIDEIVRFVRFSGLLGTQAGEREVNQEGAFQIQAALG